MFKGVYKVKRTCFFLNFKEFRGKNPKIKATKVKSITFDQKKPNKWKFTKKCPLNFINTIKRTNERRTWFAH